MPSTKEIPEVGTIYLYENRPASKSFFNRIPFHNFFRRKLNLDREAVEMKRQAIMKKDGHYRVRYTGLDGYRRKYFHDLYISLIDLQWRYALAVFFNVYLLSFLVFGILWWIAAYNNGDFDNVNNPAWEPCISTVYNFPKCLLFSIETQTTIGYGVSYPNTDCNGSLFLVYLQITVGILLDNILLGFIFVKFAQPKRRQKTIIFSKNACVTQHDGELAVQIRVGDIRKSHLLAAQVHGVLVRRHVTEEGVQYPIYLNKVDFKADSMDETIVLMWPMVLTHAITENSPFWNVKPADLNNEKYELMVFIEGTIETTGEFCQVRTSYTPKEFLWGHRFDRIEEFDSGNGRWEIDFAAFNDVVYTSNIRHSARELASFRDRKVSPHSGDEDNFKAGSIRTVTKTVSYDMPPPLPVKDSTNKTTFKYNLPRKLKQVTDAMRMRKNESIPEEVKASNESIDTASSLDNLTTADVETSLPDNNQRKRDSIVSTEERGYQTAEDEVEDRDKNMK